MSTHKIKQAETELKRVADLQKELESYEDCSLKDILLKSCELCEIILKKELGRLLDNMVVKKLDTTFKNRFENMSSEALEKLAFDINTPDDVAQAALAQLVKMA